MNSRVLGIKSERKVPRSLSSRQPLSRIVSSFHLPDIYVHFSARGTLILPDMRGITGLVADVERREWYLEKSVNENAE